MKWRSAKSNNQVVVGIVIAIAIVAAVSAVVLFDTTGKKGNGLARDYIYDLKELSKIDPNLIIYEQSGEMVVPSLKASRSVAVDDKGVIFVVGDKTVTSLGQGGLAEPIMLSDMPTCLAVAGEKIYVGLNERVEVYDRKGKRIAQWDSLGERAVLTSIAVGEDDVFVADAGNRIVLRYDLNGKLVNRIGQKNEDRNIAGFSIPSPYFDLAIADDGLLRVVNPGLHRIEAYTFDGYLEFSWGSGSADIEGFCGCCNPVNFAILEDGGFVTVEKGLVRVKVYDSEGEFVGVVAGPEQLDKDGPWRPCATPDECQTRGYDVAVGPDGGILVLDTVRDVIKIFTKIEAK